MKTLSRLLITLLSTGWILPAVFAARFLFTHLGQNENDRLVNSFPYLTAARDSANIAFLWLLVPLAFWSWKASGWLRTNKTLVA